MIMKKNILAFILFLLVTIYFPMGVFSESDNYTDFLKSDWSENAQYPEWYGGRYLDGGRMTYVIVEGYEESLSAFLNGKDYVIKNRSYNELMTALNDISNEWMDNQPDGEPVYIQSAELDETNNRINIELYAKSGKAEEMKSQLQDRFDGLIKTSVTDIPITDLAAPTQTDNKNHNWIWIVSGTVFIAFVGMICIVHIRKKHK